MELGFYLGSTKSIFSKGIRVVPAEGTEEPLGEPFLKVYMGSHCVTMLIFKTDNK